MKAYRRLRCSYCLHDVTVKDGITVCTYCGEQSEIRTGDGHLAVFETSYFGVSPSAIKKGMLGVLTGILIGAMVLFYIWVSQPAAKVNGPAPIVKDTRLVLRNAPLQLSGPEVKDKVLYVLGSDQNDRALGFARWASGDTLLLVQSGDTDARARLVHVTGEGGVSNLPAHEAADGRLKYLIGGLTGGAYVLTQIETGTTLSAISQLGVRGWSLQIAGAKPADISLSVSEAGLLITHSVAGADIFSVTHVSPDGVQLWQRSFPADMGFKILASLHASGEAIILVQDGNLEAGLASRLVRLDPFGQIIFETKLDQNIPLGEQLKISSSGDLYILAHGPVPSVTKVTRGGMFDWTREIPEAILSDTIDIDTGAHRGVAIVWGYQLADIQTDLGAMQLSEGGDKFAPQILSLPPGGAVQTIDRHESGGLYVLAEFEGEGTQQTDVALLKLSDVPIQPLAPLGDNKADIGNSENRSEKTPPPKQLEPEEQTKPAPGPLEPAPIETSAGPVDSMTAAKAAQIAPQSADPGETEGALDTAPDDQVSDNPESVVSEPAVQCRFVCLIDGEPFGSWQAVDPEGDDFSLGSPEAHKRVCQKLRGRVSEEAPRCRSAKK